MRRVALVEGRLPASVRVIAAVWRNPALRWAVVAFLLFSAVEFGTWVAVLLYAYSATGPGSIGIVALVQLLPAAIAAPFLAGLADRFDRAGVLVGGYAAQAVALGVAGVGMLLGAPAVLVYVAAAVAAVAIAATRPTQGALLPSISRTPEELTAANGIVGTVEGLGLLMGPLAAAAILTVGSPGHVFVVGAVASLVATALALAVRRSSPRREGVGSADGAVDGTELHDHQGVLAGLRVLRQRGDSRTLVILLGLRMVTSGGMDVLFVLLAIEVFGSGESGAALLNAALGAGTVLGGAATFMLVGRRRLAPPMALSAGLLGASLVIGALTPVPFLASVLIAAAGIGYAAADVVGRIVLQRVTPDEVLARVLGALEGLGLVGLALGSVLVPLIAGAVGPQAAMLSIAVVLPLGVALAWRELQRIDGETRVPVRTLALLRASTILAPLPAPQLEWLARRARWTTVEPSDVVIRQGDVGDAFYLLEQGRLRVTQDGVELRIVSEFGNGFGEIALLHGVRRTASVVAISSCVLLTIDRADFLEVLTGHEQSRRRAEGVVRDRWLEAP